MAILSVILIVAGAGCFYVDGMLNKLNFVENTESEATPSITVSETGETTSLPDPMFVNGLYHDDAITNILILSLDDYQEGDVGRSDSMIMLSIDTRHKKIKMTSFMRDMFVQIPGVGSNRLNTAFSYGGAPLTVKTIENNFGVDIDRYVIIVMMPSKQLLIVWEVFILMYPMLRLRTSMNILSVQILLAVINY